MEISQNFTKHLRNNFSNESNVEHVEYVEDYINPFNDITTKIIFIILYAIIFLLCFFGKS